MPTDEQKAIAVQIARFVVWARDAGIVLSNWAESPLDDDSVAGLVAEFAGVTRSDVDPLLARPDE